MSWGRIEEQGKQRRGMAMHHWGKTVSDELASIAGKYKDHVGRLRKKYKIAKEEAKREVDE